MAGYLAISQKNLEGALGGCSYFQNDDAFGLCVVAREQNGL